MPPPICLIVDDEPLVRSYVRAIVERLQFQTVEAVDGEEALRLVKDRDDALDLIVSDVKMPRLDGLSLVRIVRLAFPKIPVVLMSGYFDRPQLAAPETFVFLQKPFPPTALISAIESARRISNGEPFTGFPERRTATG